MKSFEGVLKAFVPRKHVCFGCQLGFHGIQNLYEEHWGYFDVRVQRDFQKNTTCYDTVLEPIQLQNYICRLEILMHWRNVTVLVVYLKNKPVFFLYHAWAHRITFKNTIKIFRRAIQYVCYCLSITFYSIFPEFCFHLLFRLLYNSIPSCRSQSHAGKLFNTII